MSDPFSVQCPSRCDNLVNKGVIIWSSRHCLSQWIKRQYTCDVCSHWLASIHKKGVWKQKWGNDATSQRQLHFNVAFYDKSVHGCYFLCYHLQTKTSISPAPMSQITNRKVLPSRRSAVRAPSIYSGVWGFKFTPGMSYFQPNFDCEQNKSSVEKAYYYIVGI